MKFLNKKICIGITIGALAMGYFFWVGMTKTKLVDNRNAINKKENKEVNNSWDRDTTKCLNLRDEYLKTGKGVFYKSCSVGGEVKRKIGKYLRTLDVRMSVYNENNDEYESKLFNIDNVPSKSTTAIHYMCNNKIKGKIFISIGNEGDLPVILEEISKKKNPNEFELLMYQSSGSEHQFAGLLKYDLINDSFEILLPLSDYGCFNADFCVDRDDESENNGYRIIELENENSYIVSAIGVDCFVLEKNKQTNKYKAICPVKLDVVNVDLEDVSCF